MTLPDPPAETYTIVPYCPEDRAAIEAICLKTGLRGRLEEFFCDPELFVRFWLAPYLEGSPENCLVGKNKNGEVCGYLVGSIGPGYPGRVLRTTWPDVLRLLLRYLTGRYRKHPPTGRFIRWLLFRSWRESPTPPPEMPAHFHFNVRADARKGLGWELLDAFEALVKERGLPGWYAVLFSSSGRREVKLYRRLGFQIGDQRRCTLFPEETSFVTIYRRFTDKPLDRVRLGRLMNGQQDNDA